MYTVFALEFHDGSGGDDLELKCMIFRSMYYVVDRPDLTRSQSSNWLL